VFNNISISGSQATTFIVGGALHNHLQSRTEFLSLNLNAGVSSMGSNVSHAIR
jgi:hypothetical protein